MAPSTCCRMEYRYGTRHLVYIRYNYGICTISYRNRALRYVFHNYVPIPGRFLTGTYSTVRIYGIALRIMVFHIELYLNSRPGGLASPPPPDTDGHPPPRIGQHELRKVIEEAEDR